MSSPNTRSASKERDEGTYIPEASTSKSNSPAATTPHRVDDRGSDEDAQQDDTKQDGNTNGDQEEQDNTTEEPDRSASAEASTDNHAVPSQGDWQAIWAPAQNAYYFYNSRTNETTWVNPLQVESPAVTTEVAASGASHSTPPTSVYAAQAAAEAAGIDPSLAYLDPSLGLPGSTPAGTFTAKFNARTGAFARVDARDPSHLSESERAKRMSQVYFDVGAWEREVETRKAEEAAAEAEGSGKKRKRPTKKDLERFKEQKKQKKIAKTAWLRT